MIERKLSPDTYLPNDEVLLHLVERHGPLSTPALAERLWSVGWRPRRQRCDSLSLRVRPLPCPLGSGETIAMTARRWLEGSLSRLAAQSGRIRLVRIDDDELVFGPVARADQLSIPMLQSYLDAQRPQVVL